MSLPVIAIIISGLSLVVAGINALVTHTRAYWNDARNATSEALSSFLAPEVIRARNVVGQAARRRPGVRVDMFPATSEGRRAAMADDARRTDEVRSACFVLMWTLQAVEPIAGRYIKGKNIATPEAITLYWHIGAVTEDLATALDRWGRFFDWEDAGKRTNEVLESLPVVQNGWWKALARRPDTRLPTEADSAARTAQRRTPAAVPPKKGEGL
ncbi:hypothetical protein Bra3105_18375 (plasmid) [Brachybacterium halotolerans subsp. kimchii]|uniref:hypothetical protein n=1 Tax=Brachybacterium halotolerans TaxID=2795215 RepID=UPI001E4F7C8F|nr:hypothetical protein [Brachybacterium halotolerans]UEJ84632.1 hypothetical protein Bra3105_18375 [Brachybacterium halotolerans subsp. kimchii]